MEIQFDAVYQNGILRPKQPLSLPDGTEVRVAIASTQQDEDPLSGVIGIGEGTSAGDVAEKHDEYLYGDSSK